MDNLTAFVCQIGEYEGQVFEYGVRDVEDEGQMIEYGVRGVEDEGQMIEYGVREVEDGCQMIDFKFQIEKFFFENCERS